MQLQTKFTSIHGQDPERIPYDPSRPVTEQVRASITSSLKNLRPTEDSAQGSYIDSLVLHSPLQTMDETLEAWRTMQSFVPDQVRNLGISNCNLFTLMELYEQSDVKPAVVQNRFYPQTKFDIALRRFCQEKGIIYQSFWTLTGNPRLTRAPEVREFADRIQVSPQAALYFLVMGLGNIVVLDGTTSKEHMVSDLAAQEKVNSFASLQPEAWTKSITSFKRLIGEPIEQ